MSNELNDIYNDLLSRFPGSRSDLNKTSLDDDKKVYLTSLTNDCLNFDIIKRDFSKMESVSEICSFDGVYFDHNRQKILLIEFKNTRHKKLKWKEIRLKVYESLLILERCAPLKDFIEYLEIIVVYKNNDTEQSSIDKIKENRKKSAKNPNKILNFQIIENHYGVPCRKYSEKDFREMIS